MKEIISREEFEPYIEGLMSIFKNPDALIRLRKDHLDFCNARQVFRLLKKDIVRSILRELYPEAKSFTELVEDEEISIDPVTLYNYLDNLHDLELINIFFKRGSPYQPYYELTEFGKVILRDTLKRIIEPKK